MEKEFSSVKEESDSHGFIKKEVLPMSEDSEVQWEIEGEVGGEVGGEVEGELQEQLQVKKKKKLNLLRLSLMVILLAVLALGALSYTGMIDPIGMLNLERWVKVNKTKATTKNKRSDHVIKRKARTITAKPKPAISKRQARTRTKKPIPTSVLTPTKAIDMDIPTPPPTKISPYPYSLYLGSYRTRERANKAISMYSKMGLSPYWVKMDFKEKGVWFRVYSEYFADQKQAERFRQKHQLKDATVKNTQYANLINTYSDETVSLKTKIRSLKKFGYSPYVVEGHDGKLRLFVGGYLKKYRAVSLRHELKSNGITSQVVKR
jgi:cell division protein FtsN